MADILDTRPINYEIFYNALVIGEDMVEDIKRRHEANGQKVTGQTSSMLRIVEVQDGFQLRGWKYSGTYEEGRRPSEKMPPVDAILTWVQAKGLVFDKPYQAKQYAFALARKIQREGTRRYKNHVDVFTTPIKTMRRRLADETTKYLKEEVKRTMLRTDIKKK